MNITDLLIKHPNRVVNDEITKASERLEKYMNEQGLQDFPDPVKLMKQGYVYCTTSDDRTFLIEKKHATKAAYGKNEIVWFPSSYEDSSKLTERFDVVKVNDGNFYDVYHDAIIKPKNCRTYYLKSKCFKCDYTNTYFHTQDNLVQGVEEFEWVDKAQVVTTVDTGEVKIKDRCYKYENDYYRYRQLAPDYHFDGSPFWFDETKKVRLKERGVGVELEYENAGLLCYNTLRTKSYRELWSTVRDGSLPRDAAELVSAPLKLSELDKVSNMIEFARANEAMVTKHCGYHVHISGEDLNYMDLSSLVSLAMSVQSEIFNYVSDDRISSDFCRLLDNRFLGFTRIKKKSDRIKAGVNYYGSEESYRQRHQRSKYQGSVSRHYWMNIDRMFRFRGKERHQRTVEFRLCQADWNTEHFNKMILLFYYMVEFAKNRSQDTCRNAGLRDVINIAPYNHRKLLKELVK